MVPVLWAGAPSRPQCSDASPDGPAPGMGTWWGVKVAARWEAAVAASLASVMEEAQAPALSGAEFIVSPPGRRSRPRPQQPPS
ncbi:hypothetical protein STSP_63020 [Streptomyces jeddahensis]|uniref:Uncharacterized protein n=1 Tax=Streptomyces jeddahensis TaxID=1716141 RepID=A0A177HID5_9ACTN|nr:hypothetical protein STSP_63020 [Streptomyces jeddahensis]